MKRTFFLIDDDEDDRMLFCEALKEVAPDVICETAKTGRNALDLLGTNKVNPDIIFLDINIPGMSGWQCLVVLKEHATLQNIPVIMYSTTSHPEDIEKAHGLGALCFFTKSDNFHQLKKNLLMVLESLSGNTLQQLVNYSPSFT